MNVSVTKSYQGTMMIINDNKVSVNVKMDRKEAIRLRDELNQLYPLDK